MKIKELQLLIHLSIGLLNVPLLTDCHKIRLVGPNRCSGRVEIFHQDSWGTVCDDLWSIPNAEVVCRELDCGTALDAKRRAFFGEGKERIWLDDVQCTGQESSIIKCQHNELGANNCGHGEDAGVICSEHVRLGNGTGRCSGRVEVSHDGHWRKVCRNNWGEKQAAVVCNELACGKPATGQEGVHFEGSAMSGVQTHCFGNESSISMCTVEEFNQSCEDTSIVCANTEELRLVNGTSRCSGRVEILHEGRWGTVCDDSWGMQEVAVVCKQMNCGAPLGARMNAFFGQGAETVWMDDVACTGEESVLSGCPHRGFGENDCNHNEDAGVVCSDSLRLVNGTSRCSGRVEVFHNGQWGKICSNGWSKSEAALVCKQLHCGKPNITHVNLNYGDSRGLIGYTATCRGNMSSITECSLQAHPGTCQDVALSCSGYPEVRLVNGTSKCSGRVEIEHNDQWGTICDDHWDIKDAQVVCRSVDCGTAIAAKSGAFFGKGNGPIWLDDVECSGNESSLLRCKHSSFGQDNCGHAEDASVVCSITIRLSGSDEFCSGRVEIYHEDQWYPVYNTNWGLHQAEVVCREMDCGDPILDPPPPQFDQSFEPSGYTVGCSGTEKSLTQCSMRAYVKTSRDHVADATVKCSGNVKLVNGSGACDGRVEFYHNGHWGTICSESWDINDATVLCNQLNCGRAHKITLDGNFGYGSGKTWIDEIQCNGREFSLSQCRQKEVEESTCNRTSIAGVVCSDSLPLRLANSNDQCSGRVEIRKDDHWGTVCNNGWTMNHAEVVCNLLDCGNAVSTSHGATFGQGIGQIWEASDACFGSEKAFQQCSLTGFNPTRCSHEQDVGVVCAEKIRLSNGKSECSGRLEIFHKGLWGTVCDDDFQMSNAMVVCKQLGCGQAISFHTSAHFGRGDGPIWLDNVECTGQENAITQCSHNEFGINNCGHGEDAGVICLGNMVKPQLTVSPATEVTFGDKVDFTCSMQTEHLGGTFILQKTSDTFKLEKYSDHDAVTFTIPKVDFSFNGSYHCEYRKRLATQNIEFPAGDSVLLSVTVKLEQPSLTLSSAYSMAVYSPEKIEVNSGAPFAITCAIHSIATGGYFYLTMSNTRVTDLKPAQGQSIFYYAYFEFPSVESKHQGAYSCVYAVNISTSFFSSAPSKSLQVFVIASPQSVVTGTVVGLLLVLLLLLAGFFFWRKRGQTTRALVRFSNRVAEVIKPDTEVNGEPEGRNYNNLVNELYGKAHSPEDKGTDVDTQSPVQSNATEDLTGRVTYELEPLIHS